MRIAKHYVLLVIMRYHAVVFFVSKFGFNLRVSDFNAINFSCLIFSFTRSIFVLSFNNVLNSYTN